MKASELFIRRVDELNILVNSSDEYDVLKAAATIRQLIVDGSNDLLDRVNREHKIRIFFEVNESSVKSTENWFMIDEIDPKAKRNSDIKKKNKKQFLSTVVGNFNNETYTIKDVIKFIANVLGGVHAGEPKDNIDILLSEVQKTYPIPSLSVLHLQLKSIGRVVLRAVQIIKMKILGTEDFENHPGISIFCYISFFVSEKTNHLHILDLGVKQNKNRLSLYINKDHQMTLEVFDSQCNKHKVCSLPENCYYLNRHDNMLFLTVSIKNDKCLIMLEMESWLFVDIIEAEMSLDLIKHLVIGSDCSGSKETHMKLKNYTEFRKVLTEKEKAQIRRYTEILTAKSNESLLFKGNQFLHSENHPNFENTAEDA